MSFSVKCVNVFYDKYGKHVYYIEEGELYDSHKEEGCFSSKEGLLAFIQSE